MAITPETLFSLEISELSHDGRGIGFIENNGHSRGKVVFVNNALPGQIVDCKITADKKSFLEADSIRINSSPEYFIEPLCPHQHECGGCPLQPLPYLTQLQYKERMLLGAFERIGGLPEKKVRASFMGVRPSPLISQYRNKVEFAFGMDADMRQFYGFRKRFSHEVTQIDHCALVPGKAIAIKRDMEELTRRLAPRSSFWKFFILRQGVDENMRDPLWWATAITAPLALAERDKVAAIGRGLLELHPDLAGFIHEEKHAKNQAASGERRIITLARSGNADKEASTIRMPLGGKLFELDAGSFFQVNTKAAVELAAIAGEMMPKTGEGLLDLYCGAGAPGLLYADRFKHALGIEMDRRAIQYAKKNAASPHYKFEAGDTGTVLQRISSRRQEWTTALLDPPRSGLDKPALMALLDISPDTIIYISCNPSTMARDAKMLSEKYILEKLSGVDMFPHTSHLECCGLWKRRI